MPPPTPNPTFFLELLYRLKSLLPQVRSLQTLLHTSTVPKAWAGKARFVDQLVELLPLLPAISDYDLYPPPPIPFPALVVSGKGKAHLSQELVIALNLRAGQPANLWPPIHHNSVCWHLDLRPEAQHNIDWYPGKRPKIKKLQLKPGLLLPEQELTLRLLPGEPPYPNFYPLIPDYAQPTTE